MKEIRTDYRIVIEANFYGSMERERMWKARKEDLEKLREELQLRGYIDRGYPKPEFPSRMEWDTEYVCDTCGDSHEEEKWIYKCHKCGKEICDTCGYSEHVPLGEPDERDVWFCENCA